MSAGCQEVQARLLRASEQQELTILPIGGNLGLLSSSESHSLWGARTVNSLLCADDDDEYTRKVCSVRPSESASDVLAGRWMR